MGRPSALMVATVEYVVRRLIDDGLVEMEEGRALDVTSHCVNTLAARPLGAQLVDSISTALLSSPHVEELFASDAEIRDIITEFGSVQCRT